MAFHSSDYQTEVAYNPFARLRMAIVATRKNGSMMVWGVLAAIGASLAFTLMDVFVKAMPDIPSSELTFFRGVVGLFVIPLLCMRTGEAFFTHHNKWLLCLRGFFGSMGLLFYFLSIHGLTLGDSQILAQLSAFFMCILSPIFLHERLPLRAVPALVIITAGTFSVIEIWNFSSFNIYALYGIAGGFCSAAAYIVISTLAERGMKNGTEIVFYFQIFSIIIGLALMDGFVMPHGLEWLWIFGMGVMALAAQMLMTWAFQHINSILVSFLMYTEILFHILSGWAFWGERMGIYSWIGGTLIVLGSMMLLVYKPRDDKRRSTHVIVGDKKTEENDSTLPQTV